MNTTAGGRALRFASTHFGSCAAHREEAAAVQAAVEKIARQRVYDLDADAMLGAILGFDNSGCSDSLEMVEHLMALEEEFGERLMPGESDVTVSTWHKAVMAALLGPAALHCRWDPGTIWDRSARGIVNERVRWRGGCVCGVDDGAVQQQRQPAQAMGASPLIQNGGDIGDAGVDRE